MRHFLTATAAGMLVLIFTTTAPAQQYGGSYSGGSYSGGSYYSVPNHRHQHYQSVYSSNIYAQPQFGGSFSYSTPSFGFGINVSPSYGSSFGTYSQPTYAPSYYPTRPSLPSYGHYHPHHHHGHR